MIVGFYSSYHYSFCIKPSQPLSPHKSHWKLNIFFLNLKCLIWLILLVNCTMWFYNFLLMSFISSFSLNIIILKSQFMYFMYKINKYSKTLENIWNWVVFSQCPIVLTLIVWFSKEVAKSLRKQKVWVIIKNLNSNKTLYF